MVIAFVRTILLYILIITGVRLMGKHQVGELEPSELVLAMLLSDLASVPMQDHGIPLLDGVVPMAALLLMTLLLSALTMKSVRFRALVCGRPSILVENGTLRQREMAKNRFTVDELMEELRLQGITDLSAVKYAILETSGQLSVLPYALDLPVTARQMGRQAEETELPVAVVSDGKLLPHGLAQAGKSRDWVGGQLTAHGLSSVKQVFLLSVTKSGVTYFVPKEDGV